MWSRKGAPGGKSSNFVTYIMYLSWLTGRWSYVGWNLRVSSSPHCEYIHHLHFTWHSRPFFRWSELYECAWLISLQLIFHGMITYNCVWSRRGASEVSLLLYMYAWSVSQLLIGWWTWLVILSVITFAYKVLYALQGICYVT